VYATSDEFFVLTFVINVNTIELLSDFLPLHLYIVKYAECIRENRSVRNICRIYQQQLLYARVDK